MTHEQSELSPERIAQIQDALAKITPGPWTASDANTSHFEVTSGCIANHWIANCTNQPDTAFIAQSPDFVREMLAEVERLQKELKDCLEMLEKTEALKMNGDEAKMTYKEAETLETYVQRLEAQNAVMRDEIVSLHSENEKLKNERDGLYASLIGQEHRLGTRAEIAEMKMKERDAQCAAYREALLEIENFCGLSINLNAPISAIKLKEIATKALSSDAGIEMLERMKKLEGFLSSIAYCEKPNLEVEMNTLEAEKLHHGVVNGLGGCSKGTRRVGGREMNWCGCEKNKCEGKSILVCVMYHTQELQTKLTLAKEALKFYGYTVIHNPHGEKCDQYWTDTGIWDHGERARKALAELEKE